MNVIKRYATLGSSIAFAASLCASAQAAPLGGVHSRTAPLALALRYSHKFGAHPNASRPNDYCSHVLRDRNNPPPAPIIAASTGTLMYCFGPQASGNSLRRHQTFLQQALATSSNVNAANPNEDINSDGTRAYGQSEVSVAAVDNYVMEAWNDASGFFASPCSPSYKDQLTGFALSTNGGRSFVDLGGLPNPACATGSYSGDPSVEAYKAPNGVDYFYITSLYGDFNGLEIAMDVCAVTSSIPTCNGPIFLAGGVLATRRLARLDKEYAAIDPAKKRLYVSYSDFSNNDNIDLAFCDLTNPGHPTCSPGLGGAVTPLEYLTIANRTDCAENEGAYPAVDRVTGDVYVAYEHNWATNIFSRCHTPITEVVAQVPFACLTATPTSPCTPAGGGGPIRATSVPIVSMDNVSIPGYNRFPMNDFPRIAVSDPQGTVSIVWNDSRRRPTGDIFMESFHLGAGFPQAVQQGGFPNLPNPTPLTNNASPTFNFLPALRYSEPDGNLDVTWYDRRRGNRNLAPAVTDVYGAYEVSPKATATPANRRITDLASNWLDVTSDIIPNFGDYTDNYVLQNGVSSTGYLSAKNFVAWSDGRLGVPQPFEAYVTGI